MFIPQTGAREVRPDGPPDANICIIGEAPGANEERAGKPFVGPAGRVLEQCMHSAKLTRSEVYITNVVKTRPPRNDIAPYFGTKGFTEKGQASVDNLRQELESISANVLVPMGKVALCALTGQTAITKYRGYIMESTLLPGRKVIPTIHPAAALRGKFIYRYYITHDLLKASKESDFPEIKVPERRLLVNLSYGEVLDWLDYFMEQKEVSFDIEVLQFEVSCISFSSNPSLAISFPLGSHWSVEEEVELWKRIRSILENPQVAKVGQNLIFDMQFLAMKYGIITKGHIKDTMIAHSLMYPDFEKGLGFLASIYTTQPYWKDMVYFKGGNVKKES